MTGGDSLLFMGGTYAEQGPNDVDGWTTTMLLTSSLNGTSSDPTVFTVAPGYGRPTIKGYGATGFNNTIESVMAISCDAGTLNWIVLDSLIVKYARRGIRLWRGNNITIQNCVACSTGGLTGQSNQGGVVVLNSGSDFMDYLTVDNCSLFTNWESYYSAGANCGQIQTYGTRWSTFTNNVLYDGVSCDGLVFLKGERNHAIEIAYNTLYDANLNAGTGISLYCGNDSMKIHHNIIYEVKKAIAIEEWLRSPEGNVGHLIYNNTIFDLWSDGGDSPASGIVYIGSDPGTVGGEGIEIFNNIIVNVESYDNLRKENNFIIKNDDKYLDYNCYWNSGSSDIANWNGTNYTLSGLISTVNIDSHSVNVNPVFADPANHDFHLTANTPDVIKYGGRGGNYESYMGAFPFGPSSINQIITGDSTRTTATLNDDLSGGSVPYDSLVLHWSQSRADIMNLTARDLIITNAPDPCIIHKTSLEPSTKYYFRILAYDEGALADTSTIDSVTTALYDYINQVIMKSSTYHTATILDYLSGGTDPYDSLILHWSQVRDDVVNLSARDTLVTSVSSPQEFSFTSIDSNTTYYFRVIAHDSGAVSDTSAIDSVVTLDIANWQIISVGVSDSVSGTYLGYSQSAINDNIIDPEGGTNSTWASDDSSTPHWVLFDFEDTVVAAGMTIYWAWNNFSSSWMCSQQYRIQYWDYATGSFIDLQTVNNSDVDSVTETWFDPISTTRIRYYQPANMGPPTYPTIVWLTEMQIYGDAGIPAPEPIGTIIINQTSARVLANPVYVQTPIFYQFALDIDSTYPNPWFEPAALVDTIISTTYGGLSPEYTYYWKIRAIALDNPDTSSWSWSESFNLLPTNSQTYTYAHPDSYEEVTSRYFGFSIIFDSYPNSVYFEIDRSADFNNPYAASVTDINLGTASWEPTTSQDSSDMRELFRDSGLYYWRASTDGANWITFPFELKLNSFAYPVPFRPSDGHSYITFTNLPGDSRIVIATVSGATVFTENGVGPDDWIWDVKNDKGRDLASGVYLYAVDSAGGVNKGKIVVIR